MPIRSTKNGFQCQNEIDGVRCQGMTAILDTMNDMPNCRVMRIRQCRVCGARQTTKESAIGPIRRPRTM